MRRRGERKRGLFLYTAVMPAVLALALAAQDASLEAQGARPVLTSWQARAGPQELELVLAASEALRFYLAEEPGPEGMGWRLVTLTFPDTAVAEGVGAPEVDSPLVAGLELQEDAKAGEVRLTIKVHEGVAILPFLSPDNRRLRIQIALRREGAGSGAAGEGVGGGAAETSGAGERAGEGASQVGGLGPPASARGFHTFPLRYADPQAVADILRRLIPYGDNRVQVESGRHALVVRDVAPEVLAEMRAFLAEVDRPLPQVFLEARIVEINAEEVQKLGLSTGSAIPTTLMEEAPSYSSVPLPLQPIVRSPLSLSATLDVLLSEGKARVLANPRVTTMDGVEAAVVTGERIPIFVTETTGTQTFTIKQDIVAGIELRITPRVNEGEIITAKIRTQVSNITGVTSAGYPTTSTREATTTIRVRAGETIVIGGLRETREIKQATRVPLLGQIPWLGRLFSSERIERRESELFIFVTPYLIK